MEITEVEVGQLLKYHVQHPPEEDTTVVGVPRWINPSGRGVVSLRRQKP